jgi:hypothetical protein
MKCKFIVVALFAVATAGYAESSADLTLTQSSLTNWKQGGDESVAYTSTIESERLIQLSPKYTLRTTGSVRFGQIKANGQGWRKATDRIQSDIQLTKNTSFWLDPFWSVTARTQAAPGYVYPSEQKVSEFGDPIYLSEAYGLGFAWRGIQTRSGIALRQVHRNDTWKRDGGAESVTSLSWPLTKNLVWTGRLEAFTPATHLSLRTEAVSKVRWQVAPGVQVTLNIEALREPTGGVQLRQALGIGLGWAN